MQDAFSEDQDVKRDLPTEYKLGLKENDFVLKREDPYGFWYVHREKGQVPHELQGAFTTETHAKQAVDIYLAK